MTDIIPLNKATTDQQLHRHEELIAAPVDLPIMLLATKEDAEKFFSRNYPATAFLDMSAPSKTILSQFSGRTFAVAIRDNTAEKIKTRCIIELLQRNGCKAIILEVASLNLPAEAEFTDWLDANPAASAVDLQAILDKLPDATSLLVDHAADGALTTGNDQPVGAAVVSPEFQAEVERLAMLPAIEYDRVREEVANRLGCRMSTLDKEVRAARQVGLEFSSSMQLVQENPLAWPKPVDGVELLDRIRETLVKFLILSKEMAVAITLWIVFTYVYDAGECCPLLYITGPQKRCGKSRLLTIIGKLCSRALSTSNITPSSLFRVVEAAKPTLLIDEADSFAAQNEELRGVINSGHGRDNAYVIRCVGDDHKPTRFSTWSPKALAGIGSLPETIEDRSIIISLKRKAKGESVSRLSAKIKFYELKQMAVGWGEDHIEQLRTATPEIPDFLNDRAADNWEPLLAIAALVGGEWPKLALDTAWALSSGEGDTGVGIELLAAIRVVYQGRVDPLITSHELIAGLCLDETALWNEYEHGKQITPHQLAVLLKPFKIKPNNVRRGNQQAKGYSQKQFADAFRRYLPTLDASGNAVPPSQRAAPSQALTENPSATHVVPDSSVNETRASDQWDGGTAVSETTAPIPTTEVSESAAGSQTLAVNGTNTDTGTGGNATIADESSREVDGV